MGKPLGSENSSLTGLSDPLVMTDHLGDDEGQEFLCELGIQVRILSQPTKVGHLPAFPRRIRGGQSMVGFQLPHRLCEFEPLREQMDERCVDVVNASAQFQQSLLGTCLVVDLIHMHQSNEPAVVPPLPRTDRPRASARGRSYRNCDQTISSTGTASLVSGSMSVPALRSARYFFISFFTTGISM